MADCQRSTRLARALSIWCTALALATTPEMPRASAASAASARRQGPSCDPYLATLEAGFFAERKDASGRPIANFSRLSLSLYPQREVAMGHAAKADIFFTIGRPGRPFIYLLAGLGGDGNSGYARYLMDWLGELGFTVVAIPSTFNARAAYAFDSYLRPGMGSQDAADVMRALEAARAAMRALGYEAAESYLMGVSLGAFHAAIAQYDPRYRSLFTKYILINPPLDLRFGLQAIDALADNRANRIAAGKALAEQAGRQSILERVRASGESRRAGRDSAERRAGDESFADPELAIILGESFRLAVQDMAAASQDYGDDGVFFASASLRSRELQSRFWSINEYFERIALPFYRRLLEEQGKALDVDREMSIWPALSAAPRPERVLVLHAADDFISSPAQIGALATLPIRSVVAPCGGHVGALPYPVYADPLAAFLSAR